jgi:transposase
MEAVNTDVREERGRQLASTTRIERVGRHWTVPSQTTSARYLVDIANLNAACTCPDYELRKGTCKHQHAVLFWIAWGRDVGANDEVPGAPPIKRQTYAQEDWSAYRESQRNEKHYVKRLARDLCVRIPQPPRKPGPGRNRRLRSDLAFESIMKAYTNLPGSRLVSDLNECLDDGYLTHVGHENCIHDFLASEGTTPLLISLVEDAFVPLGMIENGQYAIDATGMSPCVFDRYYSIRHQGVVAHRPYLKLHIMAGTATHGIASVKVTTASEQDSPQLAELLASARKNSDVRELSADKAYSAIEHHALLEELGIAAYIPFKDNAVIHAQPDAWSRKLCEFLLRREQWLPHYHRRSNVETVFSMIKGKFGGAIRAKRPRSQINEVLCKCLAHNLCCYTKAIFMSGLAPTFWASAPKTLLAVMP